MGLPLFRQERELARSRGLVLGSTRGCCDVAATRAEVITLFSVQARPHLDRRELIYYLTSLPRKQLIVPSFQDSMVLLGSFRQRFLITVLTYDSANQQDIQTLRHHHGPREWSNYSILPSWEGGPVFSGAERRLMHM